MQRSVMRHRNGHRHGRGPVAVAGLAVLALVTAACGSNGGSAAAPTPTTAPPASVSSSRPTPPAAYPAGRHLESFVVKGVARRAVVVVPAALTKPAPLVFVFHGHGGTGANIERRFGIEGLWPAAIVVYPYGLVGHAGKTDPTGVKSGWQTAVGESGDRDLAFYDVMLAALKSKLPVDANRVYAMGHSNGSAFVSLLLNQRGSGIAATANLSGQPSARLLASDPTRSMFMAMGMTDPIVPYANQKRAIPIAERKLGVDPKSAKVKGGLRIETGPHNLELDVYVYPGGHTPPAEVPKLVVQFFQRHALAAGA
jgi:polyhydroxybutyrate depolymerase